MSCSTHIPACTNDYPGFSSISPGVIVHHDHIIELRTAVVDAYQRYGGDGTTCTICNATCYDYTACTCNASCNSDACDQCDASCFGDIACTCDFSCYSDACDQCDASCFGYSACDTCDNACYTDDGYGCDTCDAICYDYSACTCDSACDSDLCDKCDASCFGYAACSCDLTCDTDACDQCDASCFGYTACDTCDVTCHVYSGGGPSLPTWSAAPNTGTLIDNLYYNELKTALNVLSQYYFTYNITTNVYVTGGLATAVGTDDLQDDTDTMLNACYCDYNCTCDVN